MTARLTETLITLLTDERERAALHADAAYAASRFNLNATEQAMLASLDLDALAATDSNAARYDAILSPVARYDAILSPVARYDAILSPVAR